MKRFPLILLLTLLTTTATPLLAEPPRRDLAPEERREMRKQMREHWQRENAGPQRPNDESKPVNWRELPPEERHRLREEMREQQRGPRKDASPRDEAREKRRYRRDD